MAISVVASVNGTSGSVVGTTGVTVTHGLTLADGDVLYAFCGVGTGNTGGAPSLISAFASSGWTELSGSFVQNTGGNDRAGSVLRKVIVTASGEASSYTFTATGAADTTAFAVTILQVRGVDNTTPEDVAVPTPSTITNDFTPAPPAITTATNGAVVMVGHVASFGASEVSTGITFGAPSGYTLLGSGLVASNGTGAPRDVSLAVAHKSITTASTETPGSFTHSPDDATREGITWSVAVRPAAGSDLTRTAADTVSVTDAATRVATLARTGAQSLSLSDAATRVATLLRAAPQTLSLADAATRTQTLARTAAQTVTMSDAAIRVATLVRSAAQTVAMSDAAVGSRLFVRSAADSLGITDAATRVLTLARTGTQAVTITDAATRVLTLARTAGQAIGLTDAATRSLTLARSGADAVGLSDAVSRMVALVRTAAQALGLGDAASASVTTASSALPPGTIARPAPLTPSAESVSIAPSAHARSLSPTSEVH